MNIKSALIHAATEYDRRLEAAAVKAGRYYNVHSLAHYFARIEEVCDDVDQGADLRAAILAGFSGRLCDAMLRAVKLPKATREEELNKGLTYRPVRDL